MHCLLRLCAVYALEETRLKTSRFLVALQWIAAALENRVFPYCIRVHVPRVRVMRTRILLI